MSGTVFALNFRKIINFAKARGETIFPSCRLSSMNLKEILKFRSETEKTIREGRMLDALTAMIAASEPSMLWELSDTLKTLRQHYGYMLRYFLDGVSDPGRAVMRTEFKEQTLRALDMLTRSLLSKEAPTLYFNSLRIIDRLPELKSLPALLNRYRNLGAGEENIFATAMQGGGISDENNESKREQLEKDIFLRIWTLCPLSDADTDALEGFLLDDVIPDSIKMLIVSALWLGGMQYFDTPRLKLLTDLYLYTESDELKARTVISLILLLWKHRDRSIGRDLESKISMLGDNSEWNNHVREAFIELIRTSGTQALVESVQNDIMSKITPDTINNLRNFKPDKASADPEDALFNPEWEKLLKDSDIRRSMEELGEIQEDGGDVFMAAFSRLKQFPFFNDISNWFLPFGPEHSSFRSLSATHPEVADTIATMPFLCDSDKYSTMLTLGMMPEDNLKMITSGLGMAAQYNNENKPLNPEAQRMKSLLNLYAKNLYRFHTLFRRKGEFANPFDGHGICLTEVGVLSPVFADPVTAAGIAEFYLKIKCWEDALKVFELVDRQSEPDAARYQKMGLCCEKAGRPAEAVDYYERADLLDAGSLWNLRRMVECLLATGKTRRAIPHLERLLAENPDDRQLIMMLIRAYLDNDNTEKAMPLIEKTDYLYPDEEKLPALKARAYMLSGRLKEAVDCYNMIFESGTAETDKLLDAGCSLWALGKTGHAAEIFRSVVKRTGVEAFALLIRERAELLSRLGVATDDIPLMIDAMELE